MPNPTSSRNPARPSSLGAKATPSLSGDHNTQAPGGASCPGMSHPGMLPAPGVAGRADAVARGRSASAATLGPGVPRGTYDDATRTEADPHNAPTSTVAHAVAQHHRRRLAVPRSHRVNPCFSDAEWNEITEAAKQCSLTPGGFTAAATVAYSRADRRTSIDEERRRLVDLINANNSLAIIGGRLNGLAHQLNSGGTPNAESAGHLLERVAHAVQRADTAVLAAPRAELARPTPSAVSGQPPPAEIISHHRQRMTAPRRNRTHPCFSDGEWADLTTAAHACHLKPGGYAAATALLAARAADPRAAIADTRRQLEELMESNRQFAAVGNNLNQVLVHLHPGDALHAEAQHTLRLIHEALDDVDTAALQIAWR